MYINYDQKGNYEYATASSSKRNGKSVGKDQQIYLGRVIDKERRIFKSKERGMFIFDPESVSFTPASEDVTATLPKAEDNRRREQLILDFGNAFFFDQFIASKKYDEVLDKIPFGNKDTLKAMLCFYALEDLSNTNASDWFEGSFSKYLYPGAGLDSRRISEFLESLGREENYRAFFQLHITYVMNQVKDDKGILIDSTGVPNSIHFPLTAISNHNGKINNEMRLIAVVQKSTGMPLYFRYVPGNIIDVNTIVRTVYELQALGVDVDNCLLDAGYYNDDVFDSLRFASIDFMTRVNAVNGIYKNLLSDNLDTLCKKENLVRYNDRYLYIKCVPCKVGSKKDIPAFAYICKDITRSNDEIEKFRDRERNNDFDRDKLFDTISTSGIFILISTRHLPTTEILPTYYSRQQVEQLFDIEKNYSNLVPLRVQTEETLRGHLLLVFIVSTLIKMLQEDLRDTEDTPMNLFLNLRNQKCKVYNTTIITAEPVKKVNDIYKKFYITCPPKFRLNGNRIEGDTRFVKQNKRKRPYNRRKTTK